MRRPAQNFYQLRAALFDASFYARYFFAVISAFSTPSMGARIVNNVGMLWSCFALHLEATLYVYSNVSQYLGDFCYHLMLPLFFVVAEGDRLWALRAQEEAEELNRGYTGHLHNAQSSNDEDKRAILMRFNGNFLSP